MQPSLVFTLALSVLPSLPALAEDGAALILVGLEGAEAQKIRAGIEEQFAAQGIRLLDPAATRACLKAFLLTPNCVRMDSGELSSSNPSRPPLLSRASTI